MSAAMKTAPEIEIIPPGATAAHSLFSHAELDRIERRLDRLTTALDSAFVVPGFGFRFGADAILGLVPGVGDAVSLGLSGWLIMEAKRLGAPPAMLTRMAGNVAADALFGAVPVLGDVFDVFFKANRRNFTLLREHIKDLRAGGGRVVHPSGAPGGKA